MVERRGPGRASEDVRAGRTNAPCDGGAGGLKREGGSGECWEKGGRATDECRGEWCEVGKKGVETAGRSRLRPARSSGLELSNQGRRPIAQTFSGFAPTVQEDERQQR